MAQKIVTREELLENAYRIAEENGVSALSIRGLARASAVSVGTVYRYFPRRKSLRLRLSSCISRTPSTNVSAISIPLLATSTFAARCTLACARPSITSGKTGCAALMPFLLPRRLQRV